MLRLDSPPNLVTLTCIGEVYINDAILRPDKLPEKRIDITWLDAEIRTVASGLSSAV